VALFRLLTRRRWAFNSITLLCLYAMLVTGSAWAGGPAGIKLDSTLGPSAAALAGPVYGITQNLGKLSGGNLFFSFQYFNVATGETALFTTTSAGINNVISRVTGGYGSTIDGTIELQAASGAPNFFLINPAGVTFTANAVIDVPAAFYASTANYLKFSEGNFYVDPTKISTLSSAAPEAFGFLGTTRAAVTIEGANLSAGVNGAGDFQIAAGDVTIDGGGALVGIQNTTGNIEVTAVGSDSHEVPLSGPSASTDGTVTIRNGGLLLTQGRGASNGGAIEVNAGSLLIDGLGLALNSAQFQQTGINTLTDLLGLGSDSSGPITVAVGNDARIINGGAIQSDTFGPGHAGNLSISAKSLTIDGESYTGVTGIETLTTGSGPAGFTGAAGTVTVTTTGALTVTNGGLIASDTVGSGNATGVTLTAGSLSINGGTSTSFTGISSDADPGSSGNAGQVSVTTTGATTISNGGSIESDTDGSSIANAGRVTVTTGSLSVNGGTITSDAGDINGTGGSAGTVSVTVAGAATLSNGGSVSSNTYTSGNAGDVTLRAGSLSINAAGSAYFTGISTDTNGSSTANAGRVTITTGSLSINGGGTITSDAGDSNGTGGSAGAVSVTVAGAATLSNGGSVSSDTFTSGNAGDVTLTAGALTINGASSPYFTGISSNTSGSSTANGGRVTVTVGSLSINGGTSTSLVGISSESGSFSATGGSAGTVSVTVTGAATLSSAGAISSDTFTSGNAGDVIVKAGSLNIDGIASQFNLTGITSSADSGSSGNAGRVSVTTIGATTISNSGVIESNTSASGNAGDVTLTTGSLSINGAGTPSNFTGVSSSANAGSSGNAGRVSVTTIGATTISNGGAIESDTFASGNAGDITLTTGSLSIYGTSSALTGIASATDVGSSGNAGRVSVTTIGTTTMSNAGQIESATFGAGNAGNVTLTTGALSIGANIAGFVTGIDSDAEAGSGGSAGSVTVNVSGTASLMGEISSAALSGSTGQPGVVSIDAGTLVLGMNALVSIENYATVADSSAINPTQINIQARNIEMDGGQISAASTGNVNASSIDISYGRSLRMDSSAISTSAQDGNGGPITINGAGPLLISHSNITTSVLGTSNGNGGDISINVPAVALDSGAIQANTAAPLALGGTVTINAQALVPSFQAFILGGSAVAFDPTVSGLNVVQAAAPDGVNGAISVTVPTLDLGNALLGLTGHPSAPGVVGRGLCGFTRGSALTIAGHGGVAPTAYDPLWLDPEHAWREATIDGIFTPLAAANTASAEPVALFTCR